VLLHHDDATLQHASMTFQSKIPQEQLMAALSNPSVLSILA
jgi:hypothetical protein